MTSHQHRPEGGRSPRDAAEEFLAEIPGTTAAETDALLALFAAPGPIGPGELPGEAAAVAAFRAAHPAPAPVPAARRARRWGWLTALLTAKTAAAAVAAIGLGGVAVAASTGVLPTPLTSDADKPNRPSGTSTPTAGPAPSQAATAAATVQEAARSAAAADRADLRSNRENSYAGLCAAFSRIGDKGNAAAGPAFTRLVGAAPGGDVVAFCSALAALDPAATNGAAKSQDKDRDTGKGKSETAQEKATEKREAAAKRKEAAAEKAAKTAKDKRAGTGSNKAAAGARAHQTS